MPADVVVSNADALQVYRDLLPTPRRVAPLRERSLGGFVLLLGVRGSTAGLAHHNVFFPADYDAEFDAVFGRAGPARRDPTVFVSVARRSGGPPARGTRPGSYWSTPRRTADRRLERRPATRYADRILDVLARRGVDVRDRVLFREIRTPADLETATVTPGGAIYGTPSHGLTGAATAAQPRPGAAGCSWSAARCTPAAGCRW